ncbi:MAG: glycosyltransferase family 4 protein [Acidimicrobiia bacterium]|nr:glycosyltransferase family 4 protein [Acidimicrobiia bacterium]
MSTCALVSFRLGLTDGVSVVAAAWSDALTRLGWQVVTVAGEGPVDRTIAGLAIGASAPPSAGEIEDALADADLVIVENLLTIPLNLAAARVVADALRGRPAVLHHHDPPWQRERFAHITELPPTDAAWCHVTINQLTRVEMAERGIDAVCIYNGFDPDPPRGDRDAVRAGLGVHHDETLLVHPVRAIERKGVPDAVRMCEQLGATYWLVGPAEEGYGPELDRIIGAAHCRVIREGAVSPADFYAAADAVVFPSRWEGFGNPPVEAAAHMLPAAVADYPVATELRRLGFRWFPTDDATPLREFMRSPDAALLDHNREVVRRHLSFDSMTERIAELLDEAGWRP